jgi:hypothetical protein
MVVGGVPLLTLIKLTAIETGFLRGMEDCGLLSRYLAVTGLVGVLVVLYVAFIEKEMWRRAALLVFAILLRPHNSADCRLLHSYLPLSLFVTSASRSRLDHLFVVQSGLLLIPKDYYYFSQVISDALGANDISIAVPGNITIMVLMSLMIVIGGMRRRHGGVAAGDRLTDSTLPVCSCSPWIAGRASNAR